MSRATGGALEVVTHIIPAKVAAAMVRRVETGLRTEGLDPTGVELDRLAGEFIRRAFVDDLRSRGAHVVHSRGNFTPTALSCTWSLGRPT
jgi:hypothetical protein